MNEQEEEQEKKQREQQRREKIARANCKPFLFNITLYVYRLCRTRATQTEIVYFIW